MGRMLGRGRQAAVRRPVKLFQNNHLTAQLRLTALGSLGLSREGNSLLAGRRKLLSLVVYLVRRDGRSIPRGELAALFWPESNESKARQSLRQALVELRDVLGEGLEVTDREVRLRPGVVELDAESFEREVDDGAYAAADAHWGGDFLEGLELSAGEELRIWIEAEREQLRRRRAWLGEALVRDAESRGAWPEALAHADRWATALPQDPVAQVRLRALQGLGSQHKDATPGGMALLTPDLVAREADFAILTGLWERVNRGIPGLALIEGEDGTGKSRLLEEFLRWAQRRDPKLLILRFRAFEAERDRPLLLARHLLAPLAGAPGAAAAPAAALRALASFAPEFAERFPSLPAGRPDDLPEAVARVLAEAAGESRIVLAVDDAHLADRPSRELLETLYRRPVGGVLVVLTAAPETFALGDLERRPATAGQLFRVRLGPFDQDDLERALASMAEFRPPDRAALAARILAETGGNPLAAIELATALADQGLIGPAPDGSWVTSLPPAGSPLPLPTSLMETMARRLRELAPDASRTLQAAAVLAREADIELLLELTGYPAERLETALGELVARRQVRLAPDGSGRIEFTHETLRRLVYEGLPPMRRQELHGAALAALRRRSTRSSATLAAMAHHQARARRAPSAVRSRLLATAALALLALAAALWGRARSAGAGGLILAVLPFDAGGDTSLVDLDRAAAEALGLALAHATGLTVMDPAVRLTSPGDARAAGAKLMVQGQVERTGTGLHLSGTLRDASRLGRTVALAAVDGEVDELPQLAARLAEQLFPDRLQTIPFELSAARTSSMPALRSYLNGVRLGRQANLEAAAQEYWQATRTDPGFAAAWHGLARINGWFFLADRTRRMADSAAAYATRLLPHEQLVLLGWQLFAYGHPDDAEARFRQVLAISPGNVEGTIGLAEVLYHHNWTRGRDPLESRPFWESAAAADPTDWRPHVHLWELAAKEGQWAEAARRLRRSVEISHDTAGDTRLLLAQLEGDTAGLEDRVSRLPAANEWGLMQLATTEAMVLGRLDFARACLSRLTEPGHSGEVRALAHEQLAYVALTEGHWREAMQEIARARGLEPVSAATTEALLWAAPFLPVSLTDSGRPAMRTRLARAPLRPVKRTFLFWMDHDRGREPLLRPYLDQLLAREAGDRRPGQPLPVPPAGTMRDSLAELRPFLMTSLEAWQRAAEGDSVGVIATLDSAWEGAEAVQEEISPFYARPWDHYLMGIALEHSGQNEQAASWLAGSGTVSLATLPYQAPAALRRARLLERLGRPAEAIGAYQRAVRLWSAADPEFQPWVTEARDRIAALGGERP